MTPSTLRYQLPKKAIKSDCPDCSPRHRRTLSRYVDTRTGEPLPDAYGRCDRESNCGYHLSPYTKTSTGMSYADAVYQAWKQEQPMSSSPISIPSHQRQTLVAPKPAQPFVNCLPQEVFRQSLGHYERNQFARLLQGHFGASVATDLLTRFQIGTSSRWPGACVFWFVDEQDRIRGGQIKLFGQDWHTVKYVDKHGRQRTKTSWVHAALKYRLETAGIPVPAWLTDYEQNAERSPCLFGLPQLQTAPADQPVAIVEAPKTAVLCSYYFPKFIWLAAGGKSYLNAERLGPLKTRKIVLFPDLNAYHDLVNQNGQTNRGWQKKAQQLQAEGFSITISDYLEQRASEPEKAAGLDLADYLLTQWNGYPTGWDSHRVINA